MAGIEGFEPPTCPLGGGRSIQLSYIPADAVVLLWMRQTRVLTLPLACPPERERSTRLSCRYLTYQSDWSGNLLKRAEF